MQNSKSSAKGQTASMPIPSRGGIELLDGIAAFIRRYLVCDDHQLTLLTLWIAFTQCHHHFFNAPYLHVRSAQPHSGRTLCLNILCDLSEAEITFSGLPAAALIEKLLQDRSLDFLEARESVWPFPVLIDDYHHSFGPSERQPLVSLLASGSEVTAFFSLAQEDYNLFGPKALAGNSPLPKSLAGRCIPIQLRRPKPSEKFLRYEAQYKGDEIKGIKQHLRHWLKQVSEVLAQAAKNLPPDLPLTLSPGQIKCSEPLVHIADAAGGTWPRKVRAALAAVFDPAEAGPELQILSDLRAIFREKNNPEYLATGDLLSQLRALDSRPWSGWSGKSGRRLAGHLRSFGIVSRRLHFGSGDDFMGYLLKDFHDAWERYLPPESACVEFQPVKISPAKNSAAQCIA